MRQRMRRVVAITAMLVACALISAQARVFAEVASTCCCGHALPCKCPEHQPGHKKTSDEPTMRPCGQPDQLVQAPELPACDLTPVLVVEPMVADVVIAVPMPVPAPAPDRAAPPVPI